MENYGSGPIGTAVSQRVRPPGSVAPATKPGSTSQIDGILARLHSLGELAERLDRVTNDVVGHPPVSAPASPSDRNANTAPMPGHLAGRLECVSEVIDMLRVRLVSNIERLESYV